MKQKLKSKLVQKMRGGGENSGENSRNMDEGSGGVGNSRNMEGTALDLSPKMSESIPIPGGNTGGESDTSPVSVSPPKSDIDMAPLDMRKALKKSDWQVNFFYLNKKNLKG